MYPGPLKNTSKEGIKSPLMTKSHCSLNREIENVRN